MTADRFTTRMMMGSVILLPCGGALIALGFDRLQGGFLGPWFLVMGVLSLLLGAMMAMWAMRGATEGTAREERR